MKLKKSDKIIAIIGVFILIVAAIGIIFYYENEEPTDDDEDLEEITNVELKWIEHCGEETLKGTAKTKSQYKKSLEIFAEEEGAVITEAEFKISWSDDKTQGLLEMFKRGKDELKAKITYGDQKISHTSTGSANKVLSPKFTLFDIPQDENFEDVEDTLSVKQLIYDENKIKRNVSFDVVVTVEKGERFGIRPLVLLRFLMDSGNSFKLIVNYTYYTPEFEEIVLNPATDGDIITESSGAYGEYKRDTSRGRDI